MKPSPERLWQDASAFASRAHRHHLRKDGRTPYASHCFRVALTLRHVFACEDETALAIALLHDTIEDTNTDYDDLLANFGPEVADGVAALTKNKSLPEFAREEEYDQRLARADWRSLVVKLADAFDNFCDQFESPSVSPEQRRRDAESKCRRAIRAAIPHAEHVPEVARAIAAVEELVGVGRLRG
ncbi:MAG: bifunctional (p)ppGpp synthetase/guanosine-3',5'-bis(diphosphate) 3'-pyrophosphohydrolase [Phycisphaerae bacterium]|nr:bifunctional (p)ppGpp synthetase/guanosine-3',5'-bis(diphosphate) 3'-pyrophosphohydrolase [Phycisphaerae bacterium]